MFFDGTTLGPYDIMFVKLKRLMLEGHTAGTTNALRYQTWMTASVSASNLVPMMLQYVMLSCQNIMRGCSEQTALEAQDLPHVYLACHKMESISGFNCSQLKCLEGAPNVHALKSDVLANCIIASAHQHRLAFALQVFKAICTGVHSD